MVKVAFDMEVRKEFMFKVLVVGDSAVGKTSLIKCYVHQVFSKHYKTTIGVDFSLKVVKINDSSLVRMQLWDISGSERYGNMTKVYYRDAVGAIVVFDVTRASTFEAVEMWKKDLDEKALLRDGSKIPVVLIGNKSDQVKGGLSGNVADMDEFCLKHGFIGWFQTSAKENTNVDRAMMHLITHMLDNDVNNSSMMSENEVSIKLEADDKILKKDKCCL